MRTCHGRSGHQIDFSGSGVGSQDVGAGSSQVWLKHFIIGDRTPGTGISQDIAPIRASA